MEDTKTNKDMKEESEEGNDTKKVPRILRDFMADILTSFPEYADSIESYVIEAISVTEVDNVEMNKFVGYVQETYPSRFFDILYKNESIFDPESETDVSFIPGLDFKKLWNTEGITDSIKETIWKYLQVLLFSVIHGVNSHDSFGDAAKLFEAINEDEFKSKLEETMNSLQDAMGSMGEGGLFGNAGNNTEGERGEEGEGSGSTEGNPSSTSVPDLPLPEEIHDHINGLLQGNLGKLATEIAEETAQEFDFDMDGVNSVNDVFQKMFRDPGKIMGLVQKIGSKLDTKIKDNDINQSDLMKEATEMMSKMKDMPGMDKMSSMFKNMGMDVNDMASMASMAKSIPGLGASLRGGGKLNVGAMQAALERNMQSTKKIEQMKKRHELKKIENRRKEEENLKLQREREANYVEMNEQELEELIFSIEGGEQAKKTSRFDPPATSGKKKKKKKKGKI
jgi:hypothetical protein